MSPIYEHTIAEAVSRLEAAQASPLKIRQEAQCDAIHHAMTRNRVRGVTLCTITADGNELVGLSFATLSSTNAAKAQAVMAALGYGRRDSGFWMRPSQPGQGT